MYHLEVVSTCACARLLRNKHRCCCCLPQPTGFCRVSLSSPHRLALFALSSRATYNFVFIAFKISDPEEEASNAKGSSSSNSSNSNSSSTNKAAGSDYASSTDGGSRTQNNIFGYLGSSTSSTSNNNNRVAGLPESSARKAGRGGGIHDTTWPRAGAGSTRQFRPPRFRGSAAVDGRPGGTPGGGW